MVREIFGGGDWEYYSSNIRTRPHVKMQSKLYKHVKWWRPKDWKENYQFSIRPEFEIDRDQIYFVRNEFIQKLTAWCYKNLQGSFWLYINDSTYSEQCATIKFSQKYDLVKFKIVWYDIIRNDKI